MNQIYIYKKPLRYTIVSASMAFLLLGGCASKNIDIPKNTTIINIQNDRKWWESFGQKDLNLLVEQALNQNTSLIIASYKLEQAKLNVDLATNSMLPSFSGSLQASSSRPLDKSSASTINAGANLAVGYELDLRGKLSATKSIKELEALATEQDLQASKLFIEGEVTKLYWQLAYLSENIYLSNQNIDSSTKIVELIRTRYKAGAASKLDLLMAERSLASQKASYEKLLQSRTEAMHALAIILDIEPAKYTDKIPQRFTLDVLSNIPANIPADTLSNRPDIHAAGMRLQEAGLGIDVAKSSFYPSFNLTGSIGTSSNALAEILQNPIGVLGLNMILPFLNWNENSINLKISKVAFEQAKVEFRQKLYSALKEVEDALSANERYALEGRELRQAYLQAQEAEKLYEIRYRAGASSLKDWLDAGETARNAQLSYVDNLYRQYVNMVNLYLALGG
ncbi:MAG: TolC family protein [Sulfurovaceae bacterium]|nr:TolC family protein [Sulfurovaceae bacterium]